MTNPYQLAVIGCGFFAQNHLNAWNEDVAGVQIAAVCDVDPAKAEATGRSFGVPWYSDAAEMINKEKLDFVDIVTTPPSHRPLVELAAGHGLHVICQKPMAWTMADAEAMVAACERAGVHFMVHENFRWETQLRAVKAVIDSGAIGRPFFGRVSFRNQHDVYTGQPWLRETPRFMIIEVGVHVFDTARMYFGECQSLAASVQRVNPTIQGEDVATILCDMRGDYGSATCIVDLSFATQQEHSLFPQTLVTVEGTEGTVQLDGDYRLHVIRNGKQETRTVEFPRYRWSDSIWYMVQDSVVNTQRHWVECLRRDKETETSGRQNLRTLEMVFGAYESVEKGVIYHASHR